MSRRILRRAAASLVLPAALAFAAPASAWSGFKSMGATQLTGNPSCARYAENNALCAAAGTNGTLLFDFFNGTKWAGWKSGGTESLLSSDPGCTGPGVYDTTDKFVICSARTASGVIAFYKYTNSKFSPETVSDVSIVWAPSCASLAPASQGSFGVVCVARTPDGALVSMQHAITKWSARWKEQTLQPANSYSPPNCAPDNAGDAICAWLTDANAVDVAQFQGAASVWTAALNLGGNFSDPPACTDSGFSGQLACFGAGTSSSMFGTEFLGGNFILADWSGWGSSFGGPVHGYTCADYGFHSQAESYACGVTGLTNNGFWTDTFSNNGWSGWVQQGTDTFVGTPSCFALKRGVTPGIVMCVTLQPDGTTASITGH